MNLQEIKDLMKEFASSDIYKLSLEIQDVKVKLQKQPPANLTAAAAVPANPISSATPAAPAQESCTAAAQQGTPVKSPVVGVFYSAASPEAAAYVQVGDKVQKGQTLCIIEAMKMMNEIKAPCTGEITEILVKNEDMVEYDQIIMRMKEC